MEDSLTNLILQPDELPANRIDAINHLVERDQKNAIGILFRILFRSEKQFDVETAVKGNIETLKNNFSPEIQALIHELLFESELIFYPKRAMVANLLGRFGVIESLPELYFTAADRYDNRYVRVAAMETIGALGAVEKIPFLRDSINNPNEDSLVRTAAIIALGWIRHPTAIPILLKCLEYENSEIWLAAIDALENYDDIDMMHLLLHIYSTQEETDKRKIYLYDFLSNRNVIPSLLLADQSEYEVFRELLLHQGPKNLETLEFLRESTEKAKLKQFIENLILTIQPKVSITEKMTILL